MMMDDDYNLTWLFQLPTDSLMNGPIVDDDAGLTSPSKQIIVQLLAQAQTQVSTTQHTASSSSTSFEDVDYNKSLISSFQSFSSVPSEPEPPATSIPRSPARRQAKPSPVPSPTKYGLLPIYVEGDESEVPYKKSLNFNDDSPSNINHDDNTDATTTQSAAAAAAADAAAVNHTMLSSIPTYSRVFIGVLILFVLHCVYMMYDASSHKHVWGNADNQRDNQLYRDTIEQVQNNFKTALQHDSVNNHDNNTSSIIVSDMNAVESSLNHSTPLIEATTAETSQSFMNLANSDMIHTGDTPVSDHMITTPIMMETSIDAQEPPVDTQDVKQQQQPQVETVVDQPSFDLLQVSETIVAVEEQNSIEVEQVEGDSSTINADDTSFSSLSEASVETHVVQPTCAIPPTETCSIDSNDTMESTVDFQVETIIQHVDIAPSAPINADKVENNDQSLEGADEPVLAQPVAATSIEPTTSASTSAPTPAPMMSETIKITSWVWSPVTSLHSATDEMGVGLIAKTPAAYQRKGFASADKPQATINTVIMTTPVITAQPASEPVQTTSAIKVQAAVIVAEPTPTVAAVKNEPVVEQTVTVQPQLQTNQVVEEFTPASTIVNHVNTVIEPTVQSVTEPVVAADVQLHSTHVVENSVIVEEVKQVEAVIPATTPALIVQDASVESQESSSWFGWKSYLFISFLSCAIVWCVRNASHPFVMTLMNFTEAIVQQGLTAKSPERNTADKPSLVIEAEATPSSNTVKFEELSHTDSAATPHHDFSPINPIRKISFTPVASRVDAVFTNRLHTAEHTLQSISETLEKRHTKQGARLHVDAPMLLPRKQVEEQIETIAEEKSGRARNSNKTSVGPTPSSRRSSRLAARV